MKRFRNTDSTVGSLLTKILFSIISIIGSLASIVVLRYTGVITVVVLVLNFFDVVNYGYLTILLYGILTYLIGFAINLICISILTFLSI